MSVYLRPGSPYYQIAVTVGEKVVRRSAKTKNKAEAEKKERQFRVHLGLVPVFDNPPIQTLYSELWERCLAEWKRKRPKSFRTHFQCREKRILATFGAKPISQIRPLDIESWQASLESEGLSPASVNRYMAVFRRSMSLAINWELLEKNPVKCEFLREPRSRDNPLPPEKQESFIASWAEPYQTFILCSLHQGMRRGELNKLTVGNIDLPKQIVTLVDTKSGHTRRIRLRPHILERLGKLCLGKSPMDLVFTLSNGKPLGTFYKRWFQVCQKLGLEDFRFHDLRHTFCTDAAMAGIHPSQLMHMTGHRSTKVLDGYIHNSPDFQRAEVLKLDDNVK